MPEESSVDYSPEKTFRGSVAGSACCHELLEEVSFMTEAPGNPHRQRFWRRYLPPFCAHLLTFLIYSTLVTLALNARSKAVQSKRNILYCTCSYDSTSHLSDRANLSQLLTDGSSCEQGVTVEAARIPLRGWPSGAILRLPTTRT